jgi:hypothetical protein
MHAKRPPMRARVEAPSAAMRVLDIRPRMWACVPRAEAWESVGAVAASATTAAGKAMADAV